MKVSQIRRQPAVVIHEDTSLEEAARIMLERKLRGLPVVDQQEKLCGFLSVSDSVLTAITAGQKIPT